jgi:hypothetical protein
LAQSSDFEWNIVGSDKGVEVDEISDPAVLAWLERYAQKASKPAFVRRWVDDRCLPILDEVPELKDHGLVDDLYASARAHWENFLPAVIEVDYTPQLPDAVVEFALGLARSGLSLAVLLKVYRLAQQSMWDFTRELVFTVEESKDIPGFDPIKLLMHFWSRVGQWLDHTVENLVLAYQEERDQIAMGLAARHREIITEVLNGTRADALGLGRELGYDFRATQVAFVAWVPDNSQVRLLEAAALKAAGQLGLGRPVTLRYGNRDLWCWGPSHHRPVLTEINAEAVDLGRSPVRLAFGVPQGGIKGFRTGHAEALAAQRVAMSVRRPAPVTSYRDVELVALLGSEEEASERFIERELGGLAEDSAQASRLRETVLAYLANPEGVAELAAEMKVHENTIRYRIRQAEQLLGGRVRERHTDIEAALRLLKARGRL